MAKFTEPIDRFDALRLNRTLHGRSIPRPQNVTGHNVFKGFRNPGTGDAIDLFCPAGTPVFALADSMQVRHSNDTDRKEVIYLQGDNWVGVYAHIDAANNGTGHRYQRGEIVGRVRGDLRDPHLHFELWINERALSAPSPGRLRMKMGALMSDEEDPGDDGEPRLIVAKLAHNTPADDDYLYNEIPAAYDHRQNRFLVNTKALSHWLGVNPRNLAALVPVRDALDALGIEANELQFDGKHMSDTTNPRFYIFVKR